MGRQAGGCGGHERGQAEVGTTGGNSRQGNRSGGNGEQVSWKRQGEQADGVWVGQRESSAEWGGLCISRVGECATWLGLAASRAAWEWRAVVGTARPGGLTWKS